jgi:hypothetical protein
MGYGWVCPYQTRSNFIVALFFKISINLHLFNFTKRLLSSRCQAIDI